MEIRKLWREALGRARPFLSEAGNRVRMGWTFLRRISREALVHGRFLLGRGIDWLTGRAPTEGERMLLESHLRGRDIDWLLATRNQTDVGQWFFRGRVWICFSGQNLILLANGKIPYLESFSRQELCASQYNHVTGMLILSPAENARHTKLKIRPLDGAGILNWIDKSSGLGRSGSSEPLAVEMSV